MYRANGDLSPVMRSIHFTGIFPFGALLCIVHTHSVSSASRGSTQQRFPMVSKVV